MLALGKQITSCGNQESIIWECALKSCCSGPVLFCTWLVQSHDSWVRMNPLLPPFRIICSFVVLNVHVVHILFLQIACWSATLLVALPQRAPSSSFYLSPPLPVATSLVFDKRATDNFNDSPPLSDHFWLFLWLPQELWLFQCDFIYFACHSRLALPRLVPAFAHTTQIGSLLVLIARLLLGGAFWIL